MTSFDNFSDFVPKWNVENKTIQQFLKDCNLIDVNPIGQRPAASPDISEGNKPSKSQSIIASIFNNYHIGDLTLVKNNEGNYRFESIDGGHRKRAIINFWKNKFPTHKSSSIGQKYARDLSDYERDFFLNYALIVVTYDLMPNKLKGVVFRNKNNTTPVNHQEMLNSYGNTPIANFIRSTARNVSGEKSIRHLLFQNTFIKKDDAYEEKHTYLKFANHRLDHDERVARITYMIYMGTKLVACDKIQLEEMYNDDSLTKTEADRIGKKVGECLDFMLQVAEARRSLKKGYGLNSNEFTMLYRLWVYFKTLYREFKLEDAFKFYQKFDMAMNKFVGSDSDKLISGEYRETPKHQPRLIHEAFRGYLGAHNSAKKIEMTCKWLCNEGGFDPVEDESISVLDHRRFFSRKMIEQKLNEQGYACWIDETPLNLTNAQGAHIVPHSLGGKTEYDNLVVVNKYHNSMMGSMNAYDYRESILKNKGEVK